MRISLTVAILNAVAIAHMLGADGLNGSSIVVHSPFLPPDFNPPGEAGLEAEPPVTESQFQLKGVYQLDGEYYFHIYDQRSQRGSWIGDGMAASGYPNIVEFDASQSRLVVELNGRYLQLDLEGKPDTAVASSISKSPSSSMPFPAANGTVLRRPVIRSIPEPTSEAPVRRLTFSNRHNNN